MATHLIFDTETTGLPRDWRAASTDVDNWPRVVQLAWSTYNSDGKCLQRQQRFFTPIGFTIPSEATAVHGITTARALEMGTVPRLALDAFVFDLRLADVVVAHNLSFDKKVMQAELHREKLGDPFGEIARVCTMMASTNVVRLPSARGGFKFPRLSELHNYLFGSPSEERHEAMHDVEICAKCYFELKRRGVIRVAAGSVE